MKLDEKSRGSLGLHIDLETPRTWAELEFLCFSHKCKCRFNFYWKKTCQRPLSNIVLTDKQVLAAVKFCWGEEWKNLRDKVSKASLPCLSVEGILKIHCREMANSWCLWFKKGTQTFAWYMDIYFYRTIWLNCFISNW